MVLVLDANQNLSKEACHFGFSHKPISLGISNYAIVAGSRGPRKKLEQIKQKVNKLSRCSTPFYPRQNPGICY